MPVRVRFAPSPTGALHPGSARTVLFNYLLSRHQGGQFVLRIEDTDQNRKTEGSLDTILDGMHWLGLTWDEGPEVGGPHQPYLQSQRLPIYARAVQQLLDGEHAYLCFCTAERLQTLRLVQERAHQPSRYDRLCLSLPADDIARRLADGERPVVRIRVPEGRTVVRDLLRGDLEFDNATLNDAVLLKSDGFPTYHLAATVDDHEMEITHVLRGDEWIPSFPLHWILTEMLGWEPPIYAHLPLVLGPDKTKLSKRHGAAAVTEYRDMGFLPEAMVNFLAFLGWSPGDGRETFSLAELAEAFDISKVQPSPAVFDLAKLESVNGEHIRGLAPDDLAHRLGPFVPELSAVLLEHAAPLIQTRIKRLTEAADLLNFLVLRPEQLPPDLVPKKHDPAATITALQGARAVFETDPVGPDLEGPLRALAESTGWSASEVFMTLRIALTGTRVSPPLLESAALLGRAECLVRIDHAIGQLIPAVA